MRYQSQLLILLLIVLLPSSSATYGEAQGSQVEPSLDNHWRDKAGLSVTLFSLGTPAQLAPTRVASEGVSARPAGSLTLSQRMDAACPMSEILILSDGETCTIAHEVRNFTKIIVQAQSALTLRNATVRVMEGIEVIDSTLEVFNSLKIEGLLSIRGSSHVTVVESAIGDVACRELAVFIQKGGSLNNADVACTRFEVMRSEGNQRPRFTGKLTVIADGNATISDADNVKPVLTYSSGNHKFGPQQGLPLPTGPNVSFKLDNAIFLRSKIDFWTILCSGSAMIDVAGIGPGSKFSIGEIDCVSQSQLLMIFASVQNVTLRGVGQARDSMTQSSIVRLNLFDERWVELKSSTTSHLRTHDRSQATILSSLQIGLLELFDNSTAVIDSGSSGVGPFKSNDNSALYVNGETNPLKGEALDISDVYVDQGSLDLLTLRDNATLTATNMVDVNRIEALDNATVTVESTPIDPRRQGGTVVLAGRSEMRLRNSNFVEVFLEDSARVIATDSKIAPEGVIIIGMPASETGSLPTVILNSTVVGNIIAVEDINLQIYTTNPSRKSEVEERLLIALSSTRSMVRLGSSDSVDSVVVKDLEVLATRRGSTLGMQLNRVYIKNIILAVSQVNMNITEYLELRDIRGVSGRVNINNATLNLAGSFVLVGDPEIELRGGASIVREYIVYAYADGSWVSGTEITHPSNDPPISESKIDGGHRICYRFEENTLSRRIALGIRGSSATVSIDLKGWYVASGVQPRKTPVEIRGVSPPTHALPSRYLVFMAVVVAAYLVSAKRYAARRERHETVCRP